MPRYSDHNRAEAIRRTTAGPTHITVHFVGGSQYTYSHDSAGPAQVREMKRLARLGVGLTGYIGANRPAHEEKA